MTCSSTLARTHNTLSRRLVMIALLVFSQMAGAPEATSRQISVAWSTERNDNAKSLDPHESMRQLMASARQGNAHAQFTLGQLFHRGDHVQKDLGEAQRWYRAAAKQGHAEAQFILGIM